MSVNAVNNGNMDKSLIKLSDWQRILLGNAPVEFLLETLIRTLIIYTVLLVVVRISGKRMSGQLTSTEMAVMLVLGAIVSAGMQTPERGLLQGVFLLFLILFFQQSLSSWMRKNEKLETLIQGKISILVKEGELQLKEMKAVKISRQQLFSVLRNQQILQLGEVKRLYLEACGDFTTYRQEPAKPGLSLLPPVKDGISRLQEQAADTNVCNRCGHITGMDIPLQGCPVCGEQQWKPAVK
jgi:uncharacterized membrane protein YcaP (DUF421 family)